MKLEQKTTEYNLLKNQLLSLYKVSPTENFDASSSIRQRIDFLKNHLVKTNKHSYVLGISGGVDSTAAGKLAQIACEELRKDGYFAEFIALRLPAGVQFDEEDAQEAINFISPDKTLTINIGSAADELNNIGLSAMQDTGFTSTRSIIDFNKGNIKARLRMLVSYQQAGLHNGLVLGTNNNCEIVSGFFTKFADNAIDINVLNGLNKRQVKLISKELGASEKLWNKVPTADLEELTPGKTDEDALGFKYDDIDDFLEGKEINPDVEYKIVLQFLNTKHKRNHPVEFV